MKGLFSPERDRTAHQRQIGGGMSIQRTCGKENETHQTRIQKGGKKLGGIWWCAACIERKGQKQ